MTKYYISMIRIQDRVIILNFTELIGKASFRFPFHLALLLIDSDREGDVESI